MLGNEGVFSYIVSGEYEGYLEKFEINIVNFDLSYILQDKIFISIFLLTLYLFH